MIALRRAEVGFGDILLREALRAGEATGLLLLDLLRLLLQGSRVNCGALER